MIDQKDMADPQTEEKEPTLTVKEFAKEMGWSESSVIRAIKEGRLKSNSRVAPGLRKIPAHAIPVSEVERLRNEAQSRQGE